MTLPERKTPHHTLKEGISQWRFQRLELSQKLILLLLLQLKNKPGGGPTVCVLFCSIKQKQKNYGWNHGWEGGIGFYTFCSWRWVGNVLLFINCNCTSAQHPVGDASLSARSHWLLRVSVRADPIIVNQTYLIFIIRDREAPTESVALRLLCKRFTLQDYLDRQSALTDLQSGTPPQFLKEANWV